MPAVHQLTTGCSSNAALARARKQDKVEMMHQPTEVGATGLVNPAPTSVGRSQDQPSVAIHYVFSTHNRRPVFEVEGFRSLIERLLRQIAMDKGFEVLALTVLAEHVHLLVRKGADRSDAEVMKLLKGASARYFFLDYPQVKEDLGSQSLWAHRYYSQVVPPNRVSSTTRYIKAQKDSGCTDKRYEDGLVIATP